MSLRDASQTDTTSTQQRRRKAVLLAFLVTLIWSSSWVLIKFGLESLHPVGFAGLRYGLATICLLPFVFKKKEMATIRRLSRGDWFWLILLGVLFYTIAQAGQYVALAHLPAVTVSLMLSLTAIVVFFWGSYCWLNTRAGYNGWVSLYFAWDWVFTSTRYHLPMATGSVWLLLSLPVLRPAWDPCLAGTLIEKRSFHRLRLR